MFYLGCGTDARMSNSRDQQDQKVAVTVGDYPIYANDLMKQIEARRQQSLQSGQPGGPDALPARDEAFIQGNSVTQAVQGVGYAYLAKKDGAKFTDEAIRKSEEQNFEQSVMMTRMQVSQQQGSKGQMSDKQFDDFLKKQTGMTLAEQRAKFLENLKTTLKDTKARASLETSVARSVLLDNIQSRMKPTDAELKASYDSYIFKRILFSGDPKSNITEAVQKAQADLKGGLTFEQAMDRYSKDPPLKGKKASDNTTEISVQQIDGTPSMASLKSMKPGQVSDVIDSPTGKAIYRLESVKNTAPADLVKNKARYSDQYASQKANDVMDKEIKDLLKSNSIKWESPGYKAIFDWMQASNDFGGLATQATKMQEIMAEAKKALSANQGYDQRAALFAWYAAFDSIWSAPNADKKKLAPDRIEVLRAVTADTPYFSLKMELVDLLADAKQGNEAGALLKDAAESNVYYDAVGQKNYQDVNLKLLKLRSINAVTVEQEKAIQKAQEEWIKQNQQVEEQKAQMKIAQEAEKKKADQLRAEQLAEAAKAKAEADKAKKPASSTTPADVKKPGTTVPTPATSGTPPDKKK